MNKEYEKGGVFLIIKVSLLENIGYVLGGFIIIVSVFLLILTVIEKKLLLKLIKGRYTPNELYIIKISKLDIKNPQSLKDLDRIARMFFSEAFHINGNPDYSKLSEIFYQKNNKKARFFCEQMMKFLYSNQEISKKDLQEMIRLMAEIISSNKIISKEEKEILDKKALEKSGTKSNKGLKSKIPFLKKK